MGFLAMILGPLMRMLYQLIPNFALTMIVFTVIIKLVTLPLAIKQQKSMAKMSVFTPLINEIQQKYKNNQEKQQEEMLKLQQEYGFSPTAGCLPMLITFLLLFGMIEVVYRPVQYILGIPKDAITAACEALGIATNNTTTMQTMLISQIHAGAAATVNTGLTADQISAISSFNTDFLGMDMCVVPGFHLSPIIIFPIIAAVTMFLSYGMTQKMSGQQAQMQRSMKIMMWGMNIMFVVMCFQLPVAFSLYYGTSNICQLLQTALTYTVYSPEKFKAQYEAELAAKKAAKKEKKTVTVQENGKKIEKEVSHREADRMRLEYARQLDAERDAYDRTVPLTAEQRAERDAQTKTRKRRK
ncbi:MAG: membrane protein insertase YidC [Gemmiger sp.]|uniref:membrane protein insertase YidC n=1 Tax=Gemmiger sp. TaxID=2049027 RepID=UPI002E771D55|nr:membrane protein insertase YidC [Gemmiger sp.]MEE0800548.1 membrane protein insertase YidC [Gemmiger sp.]